MIPSFAAYRDSFAAITCWSNLFASETNGARMANTTESAGSQVRLEGHKVEKEQIHNSIHRVTEWLEKNDYRGYDTFDGLNAKLLRPFTFNKPYLRIALQQGARRFPINLRPLLGIAKSRSTKGMGFIAKGFMRMHEATGEASWRNKAETTLDWLLANQSTGYSGACWGNHVDYQSRCAYVEKGVPHAFLHVRTS